MSSKAAIMVGTGTVSKYRTTRKGLVSRIALAVTLLTVAVAGWWALIVYGFPALEDHVASMLEPESLEFFQGLIACLFPQQLVAFAPTALMISAFLLSVGLICYARLDDWCTRDSAIKQILVMSISLSLVPLVVALVIQSPLLFAYAEWTDFAAIAVTLVVTSAVIPLIAVTVVGIRRRRRRLMFGDLVALALVSVVGSFGCSTLLFVVAALLLIGLVLVCIVALEFVAAATPFFLRITLKAL